MHLSEVNKKKTIIGSQRLRHNQGAPSAEIQGGGSSQQSISSLGTLPH